jgi:hypothetical protein
MIKLNLCDMFDSDTLRSRSTAAVIINRISKVSPSEEIMIDFKNVLFTSRSFCHELLTFVKNKKKVSIVNTNMQVGKMMEAALKKPEVDHDFSIKKVLLCI